MVGRNYENKIENYNNWLPQSDYELADTMDDFQEYDKHRFFQRRKMIKIGSQ